MARGGDIEENSSSSFTLSLTIFPHNFFRLYWPHDAMFFLIIYFTAHCYISLFYFFLHFILIFPFYRLRERNLDFLLYVTRYYYRAFYIFISMHHVYLGWPRTFASLLSLINASLCIDLDTSSIENEWVC